jgi:SAM-dependent methyltransferase
MQPEALLAKVERYYSGKFADHGPCALGVDWSSESSQELRFVQLASLYTTQRSFSINDIGSGYGAFAAFLNTQGFTGTYTGYDLSQAMLTHARRSYRNDERFRFVRGTRLRKADYSVASGIFNVKLDLPDREWTEYVEHSISSLARASDRGFAFNMLTSYSDLDHRRDDLYYADPRAIFDLCKREHSRNVALLHDYGLWEFTVIVRFEG